MKTSHSQGKAGWLFQAVEYCYPYTTVVRIHTVYNTYIYDTYPGEGRQAGLGCWVLPFVAVWVGQCRTSPPQSFGLKIILFIHFPNFLKNLLLDMAQDPRNKQKTKRLNPFSSATFPSHHWTIQCHIRSKFCLSVSTAFFFCKKLRIRTHNPLSP